MMKPRPILISLTLFCAALFLCSCEVIFTHAPAGKPRTDKALLGRWLKEEETKPGWVQFDEGKKGEIKISLLPSTEKNPFFTATIVAIANQSYLILNPTNEERDKGFMIARYQISGDELVVWTPKSDKFNDLIQQQKITGEARSSSALVTDSSENVARLLQSKGIDDAFEVFGKFKRVKS